jgi:hypothetical protein
MTTLVRQRYIELHESLLYEVSKLYQLLVNEETPENLNWGHVGTAQHYLEMVQHINSTILPKE